MPWLIVGDLTTIPRTRPLYSVMRYPSMENVVVVCGVPCMLAPGWSVPLGCTTEALNIPPNEPWGRRAAPLPNGVRLGKARRAGDLLKDREQGGRGRHELPLSQIEPAPSRLDRSRALTSGGPNLVLNHEAGTVGTHRERRVGHGHRLVEAHFAEVFEFVLAHHGAEREPAEFAGREAVFGKERQSDVGCEVEVSPIRHVTVEVHGTPTREKLLGVAISEA